MWQIKGELTKQPKSAGISRNKYKKSNGRQKKNKHKNKNINTSRAPSLYILVGHRFWVFVSVQNK